MKKFLFTLVTMLMTLSVFAHSDAKYLYVNTPLCHEDDLSGKYVLVVSAEFPAYISAFEANIICPEGMTVTNVMSGADYPISYYNSTGEIRTLSPAISINPNNHGYFIVVTSLNGYWQDPNGDDPTAWVSYGTIKWEAGYYEEFLLVYVSLNENYHGGNVQVQTSPSSANDTRGETIRDLGDQGFDFLTDATEPLPDPNYTVTNYYIVGDNPFGGWKTNDGAQMNPNDDGTYSYTVTIDGAVWFVFSDGLTENESDWDTFNNEMRFGPDSGHDETVKAGTWYTTQRQGNGNGAYKFVGNGSEYVFIFNPETLQFFIEGNDDPYPMDEVYTVAGTPSSIFGTNWDPTNTDNDMTLQDDGTYMLQKQDCLLYANNDIMFKVVCNHTWEFAWPNENYTVHVEETGTYDITIWFNPETYSVTCTLELKEETPDKTATPVITVTDNPEEEYVMIEATGDGTVKLYVDGMLVTNPFMYRYQDEENEIVITATAQEEGKEISETAELTYIVPAKTPEPPTPQVTEKPTISYFVDMDNEVVIVTATGNGHIILMWDEQVMAEGEGTATWEIPFCEDPEGEEYGVSATAQEEGKEVSEPAVETIEVPGKQPAPYETPAPVVTTELTDEALVVTATGEGTVTLYIQYIDNETGVMTTFPYEGEGTVVVPVARGEEDTFINYWAVAQADEDAVPGISEVEYYVEVPAKENVEPEDPHATGWWIVLINADNEEVWYPLHQGEDGSWVTTLTLNYGDYGTFYWDPDLSADENNLNRPNVPYYFVVNGQAWGAPEADQATLMGEAANTMSNPLYENENHYTVPVGYAYVLGIYVDPSTDDQLQDGTWYYVYCAQGPQTDVDEVNAAKTVAGVRYFNLAGQEMQEANGMTIVVTTYTDGTTSAVKVMK